MNITKLKTLKITALILTVCFILAEFFCLFLLPAILNSAFKNNTVQNMIKESSGLDLDSESVNIRTTPLFNADIYIKKPYVTDKSKETLFKADYLDLRVFLPSLIFKTPEIKRLNSYNLTLNIKREKDGGFYLGTYKLQGGTKIRIKKLKAVIEKSRINFIDNKLNESAEFVIEKAQVANYTENKYLDLKLKAKIKKGTDKNAVSEIDMILASPVPLMKNLDKLKINGTLRNFDIGIYEHYLGKKANEQIKTLSGLINADFKSKTKITGKNDINIKADVKNFAVIMHNSADSFASKQPINLEIEGSANQSELFITSFNAKTPDWTVQADGTIKNYKSKSPKLDLALKIPKSELYPLYHLLPSQPDSNEAIQKLKKYGVWAYIESDLKIKGKIDSPDIFGKAVLTDVYILKYDKRIPKCRIDIDFIGQKFNLYTKVFTRPNQYIEVKGTAENKLGGYGDFFISSSPEVDLETAHTLLIPVHDVVGFDLGPLPYMKLQGTGNINIATKGTVLDGFVNGEFNFKNTRAELEGLGTTLENATGRLDFKGKNLYFKTSSGKIKTYPIKIEGKADLDGNIDFKVISDSISGDELLSIVKNSPSLKEEAKILAPLEKLSGNTGLNLVIKGQVNEFRQMLEKVNISGSVTLKNNTAKSEMSPVVVKNLNGKADFYNSDWKTKITGNAMGADFSLDAKYDDSSRGRLIANFKSDNIKLDEVLNSLSQFEKNIAFPHTNSLLNINAAYDGPFKDIESLDYNKLVMTGYFKPAPNSANQPFIINTGRMELKNGSLDIKNFNAKFLNTTANFNGKIDNVFDKKPIYNYDAHIGNFDVAGFDNIKHMKFIPPYLKKILNAYENYSGRADVDITCKNNKQKGTIKLQEIKFTQRAFAIPIIVYSGDVLIDNGKYSLKSLNAAFDNTPVFINASVKDIDDEQGNMNFDGYFTTKLTESFANKYINNRLTYPVKPKGDITVTSEFRGDSKGYRIKPKIKLGEEADIYYMGANLGDVSSAREINADIDVAGDLINVKKFAYLRYMTSQNDYTYPLEIITAAGKVYRNNNKFLFSNMRLNTTNNASVKIFNVLFRKSLLKEGMFRCNLLLNGDAFAPKILGDVSMTNVQVPMYETTLKDLTLKFTNRHLKLNFTGESFDSDFKVDALIANSPSLPVKIEKVKVRSNTINLDSIINSMNSVTLSPGAINSAAKNLSERKEPVDISDFIILSGEFNADNMLVKGLSASNDTSKFTLGADSVLKVSDINFEITGGTISGDGGFDFNTGKLYGELSAKNVDANKMATAFFDVKDQVFGSLDGNAILSTKGGSEEERLRNANGNIYFVIRDGKMPKLGSIEYLLKAGNLIKSGITGLSINNFLDILAPVKTGYFDSIKGIINLKDGTAQNLEIYSSGDNLSLFIRGTFDFPEQSADLNVFGRLTKKANNILGPIGNASFNSLLNLIPGFKLDSADKARIIRDINKIPGVELNDQVYRIFSAKIDGDINSEKYVSSFKWIE